MDKLTFAEKRILRGLKDGKPKSETFLKAEANWPRQGIRKQLRSMMDKGFISAQVPGNWDSWILTPKGRKLLRELDMETKGA